MRRTGSAVALVLLLLTSGLAARAQQVKLADGTFASPAAYFEGTWKWERQEPRQTMILRFNRDGTFYFQNFTVDIQHWGTYRAWESGFSLSLTRTCEKQGSDCTNRNPTKVLDYPIKPTSAKLFMSESER